MITASMILIALALNIDALGVGVAYGIRRIRLPFASMLVISLVSMTAISLSMLAGQLLGKIIPPYLARHIGGLMLVIIGVWALYQYFSQNKDDPADMVSSHDSTPTPAGKPQDPVSILKIQFLGLIIQILKEPHRADLDTSGVLSGKEAFLLGASLALDSLVAGIAISLLGFNILMTAFCVSFGQLLSIWLGLNVGRGLGRSFLGRHMAVVPGLILILLGVARLY
ncbi:MAG: sporulation membrane protein YtaF [Bacillota bacterium]